MLDDIQTRDFNSWWNPIFFLQEIRIISALIQPPKFILPKYQFKLLNEVSSHCRQTAMCFSFLNCLHHFRIVRRLLSFCFPSAQPCLFYCSVSAVTINKVICLFLYGLILCWWWFSLHNYYKKFNVWSPCCRRAIQLQWLWHLCCLRIDI